VYRAVLDLIAPPLCAICGRRSASEALCAPCDRALAALTPVAGAVPGVSAVWSAGPYEGVARDLVAALKFGRRLRLADVAARAIAASAPPDLLDGTVVPVPPSPLRARWRGFDAADTIASALARTAGLPFEPCLRRANGRRQVGRSRTDRLAGPPRVSAVGVAPESTVLVDDVMTTGATLAACARALRASRSCRVVAVTFASSR
jgi:ComF family protein